MYSLFDDLTGLRVSSWLAAPRRWWEGRGGSPREQTPSPLGP
jgi:hypothetical protein